MGERAHRQLAAAATLEPRITPSIALAYALAALVHVLSLTLLLGGAALVWTAFPNPFVTLPGGLMVAAAVLMRPRFGKPPSENLVSRDEAPALWRLVDEVAAALAVAPPDRIVVDPSFNAFWTDAGLRRTRVPEVERELLDASAGLLYAGSRAPPLSSSQPALRCAPIAGQGRELWPAAN